MKLDKGWEGPLGWLRSARESMYCTNVDICTCTVHSEMRIRKGLIEI